VTHANGKRFLPCLFFNPTAMTTPTYNTATAEVSAPGVSPGNPHADSPNGLRRDITGPLLFVFILGDVLGAGIYALMGVLAGKVGGALWAPLLLALLLALLTAGSYAELVTKYPRAGGAAVFAERAFGQPLLAFLVGFAMLAAGIVSAAGLSLAFAGDYLRTFVDVPQVGAAAVFLVLIACLNARGISESMKGNLVMTVIELSGLVIVIAAGALLWSRGQADASRALEFPAGTNPALATLSAAIIAYYAFVGFETSANVVEEIREPARVYPKALFSALCVAGLVYVLVGLASAFSMAPADLAKSSGPLLAVVDSSGLGVPRWVFSLIALVAVANGALLTMIMASRLTFGMAADGLLPPVLAKLLPERRTPWVAIVVTTFAAIALTILGTLQALAETVVLLLLFVFISTNVAVLVLRREKVAHAHFRVWSFVPVLGVLSCLLLLSQQRAQVWIFGAALLALGAVLYGLSRLAGARPAAGRREAL
jgi:basic amino acid/polyamine antiporter, APA family